jgi:CheY-like chemotaxis protein
MELQLHSTGFDVDQAGSAEAGLKLVDRADLVITDLRLPGMDGLQLLSAIRHQNSHVPVIVVTAFGTVENAVEAMKDSETRELTVSTLERDDRLFVEVGDTGPGISEEVAARLFQPFVQLDSRLAREYEGTGLGLALVYRMVEMHGGSIAVTSEVGRGLIAYDADDAERIKGRSSPDVMAILGISGRSEMIHRDDLVMGG